MLPGLHKAALSLHPLRLLFLPKGGRMQSASVKWIGEQKFVATSPSGHAITLDSDRESNQAPGPMELLLMALGACAASSTIPPSGTPSSSAKTNTARSPQCSGKRPRCPGATRFWPLLPEPAWSAPDLLHPSDGRGEKKSRNPA